MHAITRNALLILNIFDRCGPFPQDFEQFTV